MQQFDFSYVQYCVGISHNHESSSINDCLAVIEYRIQIT